MSLHAHVALHCWDNQIQSQTEVREGGKENFLLLASLSNKLFLCKKTGKHLECCRGGHHPVCTPHILQLCATSINTWERCPLLTQPGYTIECLAHFFVSPHNYLKKNVIYYDSSVARSCGDQSGDVVKSHILTSLPGSPRRGASFLLTVFCEGRFSPRRRAVAATHLCHLLSLWMSNNS